MFFKKEDDKRCERMKKRSNQQSRARTLKWRKKLFIYQRISSCIACFSQYLQDEDEVMWWQQEVMKTRKVRISTQLLDTISHAERKTTHSLIVEDEKRDNLNCEWWDVESSFTQRDASSAEEDVRLDSSCNHAFLRSNACICKHAQWEHDTCELSLRSDDERSDSIRSSDHDDLTYISIYWNMQR